MDRSARWTSRYHRQRNSPLRLAPLYIRQQCHHANVPSSFSHHRYRDSSPLKPLCFTNSLSQSSEYFRNACTDVFERMINTVPDEVNLSEVISPLPIKPVNVMVEVTWNGTMSISGFIRVSSPSPPLLPPSCLTDISRSAFDHRQQRTTQHNHVREDRYSDYWFILPYRAQQLSHSAYPSLRETRVGPVSIRSKRLTVPLKT